MSEVWKKWEGQVADNKYRLQEILGSTDHSVVFLAELSDPEPRKAAVKFISADLVNAQQQLAAWNNAATLSHPNLLRIYGTGRCKMEGIDVLYVVMEYAEENLGQVLPQRALLAEETRDMLNAVVDVLVYLHGKNLTHGHVRPSNILASGDLLKLSCDTILPGGEVRQMRRERSAYDAPELPGSPYTSAADMWSLGVTLVEAFTQQPGVLPFNEAADPVIPAAVREPFLEIARHTLRRNPRVRWSSAQIAEKLNPATAAVAKAASAAAGASANAAASASAGSVAAVAAAPVPMAPVSPLQVPLSKERAIPLAKLTPAAATHPAVVRPVAKAAPRKRKDTVALPSYVIPMFAGIFAVIALIMLPKVLRHREISTANGASSAPVSSANNAPAYTPSSSTGRPETPAKPSEAAKATAPKTEPATPAQPIATAPVTTATTVIPTSEATPAPKPRNSRDSAARGEVLDQVLPEPLPKALATIHGTMHIGVKVQVDAAGNVSEATLDMPSPSRYFADQAVKAAQKWVFTSPESDGRSVPSEWLIHFYFTKAGTRANASQTQP